ncbi:hypothetical protein ACH4D4_14840 [Streptomyces pristinaespiralis]|jgi:hypothetical protein|uniref:hypothetical protein n=1 Tax=Streptomyces pristinaespiralis TaxID=38300 RepID=UPI0037A76A08
MSAAPTAEGTWRTWIDTPVRWAGAAAGVAVGVLVDFSPEPDVQLLYAFPAFGLCVMAGVLAADLIARPRHSWIRVAEVTPRRVRDYAPRALTAFLTAQAVILTVLVVIAASTASADAKGRSGRALAVECPAGSQLLAPWPGLYYAWPALGGVALGALACALLLRRVTLRSQTDDQRRVQARAAVGAWGVVVTAPLFAVSFTMAVVVLSLSCAGVAKIFVLAALALTAFASALSCCHCLGVLLIPQAYTEARP